MSIQYSGGTLVNATFTQSAGTRAELADSIKTQLVSAGWTSVTNAASDYTLTSATTPQSLVVRARVYDPGAGNCARLKFSDAGGVHTQAGDLFLLPAASKVWRVVASKYQFFVTTPAVSAVREFACGGTPWVPSFLAPTNAAWCHGNATTDTDVTARASFRTVLGADGTSGNQWSVWNSSAWEANGTGLNNANGSQKLDAQVGGAGNGPVNNYRWADGTAKACEPLIGWGLTASTDEAQLRGQLWDAVVFSDAYNGDATYTFDGHTYIVITHNNAGSGSVARGTLLVAVA
jgi:hypothetical protein